MLLTLVSALTISAATAFDTGIGQQGLPSAAQYSASLLPDRPGVLSWSTLAKVETVNDKGKMIPKFDPAIRELDRTRVLVRGFMVPLDVGDQQHHFVVSAVPPHCPFCLPAGPEALMEVKSKSAVGFTLEPVLLRGKLVLLKDDSYGLLYQLIEADAVHE